MNEDLPFSDSKNVAVFTNNFILRDGATITQVLHDRDDGAWQFHCDHPETNSLDHATMISLQEIVILDPSIIELHDLPLGWRAMRAGRDSPWIRYSSD